MTVHVNILITGNVQKVGFRYHTRRAASVLGLSGFVRNNPDETVYIEAEGDEFSVQQLVQWCHHGPSMAQVENVKTEKGIVTGFTSFEIR
jgi:acylphosphatase